MDDKDDDMSLYLSLLTDLLKRETGQVWKLAHYEELKSAQQRVLVVTVVQVQEPPNTHCYHKHGSSDDKEHNNYVHTNPRESPPSLSTVGKRILEAIEKSRGRLVLRIWKAGARWWNLTSNAPGECIKLAKSEVAGYKLARRSLEKYYQANHPGLQHVELLSQQRRRQQRMICIPDVLYFDPGIIDSAESLWDDDRMVESVSSTCRDVDIPTTHCPWAVFSHVKNVNVLGMPCQDSDFVLCDDFIANMVKIRKEFGFDEPHPRHGRVCVDQALEYAMQVLNDVIVPLQTMFFKGDIMEHAVEQDIHTLNRNNGHSSRGEGVTYQDMVHLYQSHHDQIRIKLDQSFSYKGDDETMRRLVDSLEEFIKKLSVEATILQQEYPLPFTLCHLDLQPQNMILYKNSNSPSNPSSTTSIPRIAAVLDWEESCYADPRFELLLVCRKVVANRSQAEEVWKHYGQVLRERFQIMTVGPLEPWLRLESVHSLLTMCMQGLDLLEGGGRSPWEGQSDLRDKIDRELYRLQHDLGWGLS